MPDGGGWPAVMAANHALALEGRDIVAGALGIDAPAPDAMLGSMAALPLAARGGRGGGGGAGCGARVGGPDPGPDRTVAGPGGPARRASPPRILLRISAQRYNEPADYERLADAPLERRGVAP